MTEAKETWKSKAKILRYVKGGNRGNNAKQTDKNGKLHQSGYWRADNGSKEISMRLRRDIRNIDESQSNEWAYFSHIICSRTWLIRKRDLVWKPIWKSSQTDKPEMKN